MDRLSHYIDGCLSTFEANIARGAPPADILANYCASIETAIRQLAGGAPGPIKATISVCFNDHGWDFATNKPAGEFGPEELASLLKALQAAFPVADEKEEDRPPPPVDVTPTAEELADVSLACARLWELDTNRLEPGVHYEIDPQGGKKAYQERDAARDPLFKWVDESVFKRETYASFFSLLDNYERETGKAEVVTEEEKMEMWDFLHDVMETAPMRYVHEYLVKKGKAKRSPKAFAHTLHSLWFELYRRECGNDSSGFEHVFVGEEKDGKITGFHNWIQFYVEEKKGNVDYRGFIVPRRRGAERPDDHTQLLSIQFAWYDDDDGSNDIKSVSSMFVGTSPEFELALYTLCFIDKGDKHLAHCGDYTVEIESHAYHTHFGDRIGTVFPSAVDA